MPSAHDKAKHFHSLHVRGQPLVLFNIWDVGSAKAVADAGARALATGSWSVAKANGYEDGERVPLDLALANLARITRATELPVTVDLESGYGRTADAVRQNVERSIEAGAVGCNIEDVDAQNGTLRAIGEQVEHIKGVRMAAAAKGIPFFINARTDIFFGQMKAPASDTDRIAAVLERAAAYAAAGATGLFVPGLVEPKLIAQLTAGAALPLNIMMSDKTPPVRELASLGVARVSHGPRPYLSVMKMLGESARAALRMD